MRYEPQEVRAIDRGIPEALATPIPVRVEAAAADLHDRAGPALLGQGADADLPGDRGGMFQCVIEAAGAHVQAGVGGAGISRAERVELLDGAVRVDHDHRTRQQSQSFDRARLAQHELDELAEQADPGFLPGSGVPALEDADQPAGITGTWRWAAPVGVRQQEVNGGRAELQQRLVRGHGVVANVDRAQDAAVALAELRRPEKIQAIGDRIEAVAAVGIAAVSSRRFGVAVQADADLDVKALERLEHRPVEQNPVGLQRQVHLPRHLVGKCPRQIGEPRRSGQQRLAAVQDDVNVLQSMAFGMLGNARDGLASHVPAHSFRHPAPRLVGHLIDIAICARQIATAMNLQDELPERHGFISRGAQRGHVQIEQGPGRRMLGGRRQRRINEAARFTGHSQVLSPGRGDGDRNPVVAGAPSGCPAAPRRHHREHVRRWRPGPAGSRCGS